MDVIKIADHIIDMGPEGGEAGGRILFEGTPEKLLNNKESFTAVFLEKELARGAKNKKAKHNKKANKIVVSGANIA
jgi:excinuclease ABC subunit A